MSPFAFFLDKIGGEQIFDPLPRPVDEALILENRI
jgi:hypothetical protein